MVFPCHWKFINENRSADDQTLQPKNGQQFNIRVVTKRKRKNIYRNGDEIRMASPVIPLLPRSNLFSRPLLQFWLLPHNLRHYLKVRCYDAIFSYFCQTRSSARKAFFQTCFHNLILNACNPLQRINRSNKNLHLLNLNHILLNTSWLIDANNWLKITIPTKLITSADKIYNVICLIVIINLEKSLLSDGPQACNQVMILKGASINIKGKIKKLKLLYLK